MNRENQQETEIKDTDIAWLAGMMNGDGCFAMNVRKKKGCKSVSVELRMILTQTDGAIIERAKRIVEEIIAGKMYVREAPPTGHGKNPIIQISVGRMAYIKAILAEIIPYMVGSKLSRARMMVEYIDHRMSLTDVSIRSKSPFKDPESLAMVEKYYETEGRVFPPEVRGFLNDYYVEHV